MTRLPEGPAATGDAQRDVLKVPGMGEDGDVAMPEPDEMSRGDVAARLAIGPHGVESGRVRAAVEQHGRGQPRARASPIEAIEASVAGTAIRPSIRRAINASTRRRSIAGSSLVETSRRS